MAKVVPTDLCYYGFFSDGHVRYVVFSGVWSRSRSYGMPCFQVVDSWPMSFCTFFPRPQHWLGINTSRMHLITRMSET